VAAGIERLTENQPNPDVVIDRLNGIAGATGALADAAIRGFDDLGQRMGQTVEAVLTAAGQINVVAVETARTAAAVEKIAGRIPESRAPDVDACTALYATTVDVTGDIVGRTTLGALLNHAGFQSIDKLKGRDDFINAVQRQFEKERKDLPDGVAGFVTPEVLGCYWDRAKAVAKALKPLQKSGKST
jgi:hypothetical protein